MYHLGEHVLSFLNCLVEEMTESMEIPHAEGVESDTGGKLTSTCSLH